MTEKELKIALESATYKFAKTMPKWPHWYTLRNTWPSDTLFDDAVAAIRLYGKPKKWFHRVFIYYYSGNYMYWTMGNEICKTKLINKAQV